ncbi:MAG: 2-hydroxyacyl-CoA dehydratase [Oscillospiraceae bacterium]|nr:2-hydroxyacyl-CoA dehydratase [Oscillospiraceae bacterium]
MRSVQELLQQLHEIAANPRARTEQYLTEGKKIVLTAPVYTPEEIIHSMGLVPMGAWGGDMQLNESKRYFPAFICSIAQSIVELGIAGAYRGASAIVIPTLCDSLKVLVENFKYGVPAIPVVPMSWPQNRVPDFGKAFTKAGCERVIRDLENITGAKYSDGALRASIKVYNAHNAAMRRLSAVLRAHPEVGAAARSDCFKSAFFMLKEEHTALIAELCDALEAQGAGEAKTTPIYISGILADSPAFNALLDEAGLSIAGDDIAAQSRQYRTDAPEDSASPLDALAEKFANMNHCSVLYDPSKSRCAFIAEEAKAAGAKGVLLVLTKFCDPEEFDNPLIRRACEAAGLPVTIIEIDRQMVNYEQARTAIETFRDMLA